MERVEALDLCAKCGGYCCLHIPGRFSPDDLASSGRLSEKDINDALDAGIATIYTSFAAIEGYKAAPIFTLATRGEGRPPLSLCHDATRCVHLKGKSCKFPLDERPYECAMMVPAEDASLCRLPDGVIIEPLWVEYQMLLRKVIEKRTGRSWAQELENQLETRRATDSYANGAWTLISYIGMAGNSKEADITIAKWLESLEE